MIYQEIHIKLNVKMNFNFDKLLLVAKKSSHLYMYHIYIYITYWHISRYKAMKHLQNVEKTTGYKEKLQNQKHESEQQREQSSMSVLHSIDAQANDRLKIIIGQITSPICIYCGTILRTRLQHIYFYCAQSGQRNVNVTSTTELAAKMCFGLRKSAGIPHISWFVIILALLGVASLFVCCMIHCKHLRLSDANKLTYLLTYQPPHIGTA